MEIAFWAAFILLAYTFIGYPLAIRLAAAAFDRRSRAREGFTPRASMILAVHNEEEVIREKIENFLSLDYPPGLLELVVVSDGSNDGTEEIIKSFNGDGITLLVQSPRAGKTSAINMAARRASGDVLVFTDANSMFEKDAVRKLVRHFADPGVGLVSGTTLYRDVRTGKAGVSGAYRRFEESIKASEGMVSSIVGADGANYAVRRELFEPLRPEHINDFMHPIQTVLKGSRAISEPEAVCVEAIDGAHTDELRRQTRIMAQSWLIFLTQIGRLVRGGKFLYAWQLVSHKFMRWMTLPLMLIFYAATGALIARGWPFAVLFAAQTAVLLAAAAGSRASGGAARFPFIFFVIHYAAIKGLCDLVFGNRYVTWSPRNN